MAIGLAFFPVVAINQIFPPCKCKITPFLFTNEEKFEWNYVVMHQFRNASIQECRNATMK